MDCIVYGVTKSQTRLSDFHCIFFGKILLRLFLSIFKLDCLSSHCWVLRVLCIFWVTVLYQIGLLQTFFSSLWFVFLFSWYSYFQQTRKLRLRNLSAEGIQKAMAKPGPKSWSYHHFMFARAYLEKETWKKINISECHWECHLISFPFSLYQYEALVGIHLSLSIRLKCHWRIRSPVENTTSFPKSGQRSQRRVWIWKSSEFVVC